MEKRLICACEIVIFMKKLYSVSLIVSLIVLSSVVTYSAEAAGIPKKAISTNGKWTLGDLPVTGGSGFLKDGLTNPAYTGISISDVSGLSDALAGKGSLASDQTWTGIQTFNAGKLKASDITVGTNTLTLPTGHDTTLESIYNKGLASGYAGLNSSSKLDPNTLPQAVVRIDQSNTFDTTHTQTFVASLFKLVSISDVSKILTFDNTGMTTGKTLTIKPLSTTTQTLQIPDITTTDKLATLALTQTFTGNPVTIDNLKLGANNADANTKKITNLGAPTVSTDAARADKLGIIGSIPITACNTGEVLIYDSTSGAWSCGMGRALLTSVTLGAPATSMTTPSFSKGSYSAIDYEVYIATPSGATNVWLRFNGDSANNYGYASLTGATSTTARNQAQCLLDAGNVALPRSYHLSELLMPTTGTSTLAVNWEGALIQAAGTVPAKYQGSCIWYGNTGGTGITSASILASANNLGTGSYIKVYGS